MYYKHALFLRWLIYVVVVVSVIIATAVTGLLQLSISLDKSYLTIVIALFYILAEINIGYLASKTSRELALTHEISDYLDMVAQPSFSIQNDKVYITDQDTKKTRVIEAKTLSSHIKNLIKRSQHWSGKKPRLDERMLIGAMEDVLVERNSFSYWAGGIILLSGLVGTIIGIVLTFYPFMDPKHILDLAQIQNHLPEVFGGVGAAFFPSAFAAVFAVFLSFTDRLMKIGTTELVSLITTISETYVIPVLEKRDE